MTPRASRSRADLLTTKMHADEVEIDEALVRLLLGEQFPEWVDRPLHRVEPEGTDNAIFRLGEDLSVRLARRRGPTQVAETRPRDPVTKTVPVTIGRLRRKSGEPRVIETTPGVGHRIR